jgi:hypothetical protein
MDLLASIEIIQIGYPLFDGLPQRVDTAKRMKGKEFQKWKKSIST